MSKRVLVRIASLPYDNLRHIKVPFGFACDPYCCNPSGKREEILIQLTECEPQKYRCGDVVWAQIVERPSGHGPAVFYARPVHH